MFAFDGASPSGGLELCCQLEIFEIWAKHERCQFSPGSYALGRLADLCLIYVIMIGLYCCKAHVFFLF